MKRHNHVCIALSCRLKHVKWTGFLEGKTRKGPFFKVQSGKIAVWLGYRQHFKRCAVFDCSPDLLVLSTFQQTLSHSCFVRALVKIVFYKNLCPRNFKSYQFWPYGVQVFMLIFTLDCNILFKSILGRCERFASQCCCIELIDKNW